MPISIQAVLADAWALFLRDRGWLIRLAAPFLFLPSFALALLVPRWPAAPGAEAAGSDGRTLVWAELFGDWLRVNGGWYALAYAVGAFGSAALYAAYLDREAGDVRGALRRAGPILPRFLLAALLIAIPTGAGLYLWVVPGLYVMGRTMLASPAILAERPLSAVGALARSFALSAGAGLPLMALAGAVLLAGVVLAQPFAAIEAAGGGGRIAAAFAAAGIAAVSMATNLAQVLVAVSAYRRLVKR